MKIEKAIEILELECTTEKLKSDPDYLVAAKLGIEALKIIQLCRGDEGINLDNPLPGEALENGK